MPLLSSLLNENHLSVPFQRISRLSLLPVTNVSAFHLSAPLVLTFTLIAQYSAEPKISPFVNFVSNQSEVSVLPITLSLEYLSSSLSPQVSPSAVST